MAADLAARLRGAALEPLPEGAFLKRDRGDALYVTDAARLREGDWPRAFSRAGFVCRESSGLLRLTAGPRWLMALEAAHAEPPAPLCAALLRFRGLPIEAESLALFALGAKALDGGGGAGRFDRLLRQRAALCLRLNGQNAENPRGGGLYACAILDDMLIGGQGS